MRLAGLAILILFTRLSAPAIDCRGAAIYDCAVSLVQAQQFQPAVVALERFLAQSPQDLKALNLLGIALTGAGQIEKANSRLRQALKINPRFYPALKNLAINEFTLNRHEESKASFERVLKNAPDDDVAHLYLAEIAFAKKDFDAALRHYEKTRARVAQNPPATLHYAECVAQSGRAMDAAKALSSLAPDDSESQFRAGLILGKSGAYLDAAKSFGLARKNYSDPYTAGYDETLMLIRGGEYGRAITVSEELFQNGLRRAELYNLVSEAYLKTGQIERAYNSLRTATELEPEAEDNYIDLAGICLDYENYDLGLEIVDIGLRHLPNSFRLHLHRGVMLAQKGLTQESEKDFEAASSLSPEKSLPYAALGMVWMQRGDTAKAAEVLRDRVRKHPDDYMLPYILGIALIRSGAEPGSESGAEAKRAFEASARLNQKFGRAHTELGKLLLKGGDINGAVAELEMAVTLDGKDGAAAYQLAQAYRRKGDTASAQRMLARVTKLRDQKEGIDPGAEMKRIVREGAASVDRTVSQ
jgi:tetratricopeptide (TPR) repeat protein